MFKIINESNVLEGMRIFNSRFIDEVKNSSMDQAFEKSHLIVQVYNDTEKNFMLTQSPTIQHASQYLLLTIATMLHDNNVNLYLRNIT